MPGTKVLFNFCESDLIDKLLRCQAEAERKNKSSVAEKIILDSFLPKNKSMRDIIKHCFIHDEPLEHILVAVFNHSNCHSPINHDLIPLIQFAIKCLLLDGDRIDIAENISKCISQYELLLESIETNYKERNEKWLLIQLDLDKHLLSDLKEDPSKVRLSELYQLILDNWQLLKGIPTTYEYLSTIVTLHDWSNCNTCDNYIELLKIIRNISVEG